MMLWIGVYSAPFLGRMEASLDLVQQRIDNARGSGESYHVEWRGADSPSGERTGK